MGHIFISYSHKDSSYVHKLAEALEQEGFGVWIDDRIHYGSEWPKVVTRNLDVSDAVIVVLSDNSYESDMVQNEVARAREKKKPIFPLLLEGDNWLIVQAKQFVDVKDGSLPTEKFYKRLEEITPRKNERAEREAAEKLAQEKAARDKTEKEAKEKARLEADINAKEEVAREKEEREAAEKIAQEKVQREFGKREKQARRLIKRKFFLLRLRNNLNKFSLYFRYYIFPAILILGVIAGTFYIARPYLDNVLSPTQDVISSQSVTPLPSQVSTENFVSIGPVVPDVVSSETATPTPMPTEITDAKGVQMVLVPAGEFTMGSNENKLDAITLDEQPVHLVSLASYYIDKFEVTNSLYSICVEAGICLQPTTKTFYTDPARKDHPVVYVNWYMAGDYCEWRGARLPTEAEWEKAAKGLNVRTFPWGESFSCQYGNFLNGGEPCVGDTTIVGTYIDGVSPYGLFDMAGNVWEWTSSLGLSYPYNATDGRESLDGRGYRVLRGGARNFDYSYVTTTTRYIRDPLDARSQVGFRCVYSVSPPAVVNEGVLKPPTPTITNTATASPTYTPTPTATSVQLLAVVKIYNRFNVKKDIYVDGQLIAEALEPEHFVQTSVFFGIHDFYTCPVVTLRCGSGYDYNIIIDIDASPYTVNLGG